MPISVLSYKVVLFYINENLCVKIYEIRDSQKMSAYIRMHYFACREFHRIPKTQNNLSIHALLSWSSLPQSPSLVPGESIG